MYPAARGGEPLTQIRIEHRKWPVYVRCDACATPKPMAQVVAAEERTTSSRGMLYQVYHRGSLSAGGRTWTMRIGSITYPDRRRGWVSTLFIHAAAGIARDPRRWIAIVVLDETQQPDAKELAGVLKTAAAGVTVVPARKPGAPATRGLQPSRLGQRR